MFYRIYCLFLFGFFYIIVLWNFSFVFVLKIFLKQAKMEEDFEFLINNLFKDLSMNFIDDIPVEVWNRCDAIIQNIKQDNMLNLILQEYYIEQYRNYLGIVFNHFWDSFLEKVCSEKKNLYSHHRHIFTLIDNLYCLVNKWLSNRFIYSLFCHDISDPDPTTLTSIQLYTEKLHSILLTAFIADMPLTFLNFLLNTFAFSFKVFDSLNPSNKGIDLPEKAKPSVDCCSVCEFPKNFDNSRDECYCKTLRSGFISFRNILKKIGIFDNLCGDIIRSVIYTSIEKHIHDLCKGKYFNISCLDLTLNWFENNIVDWIKMVYLLEAQDGEDMIEVLAKHRIAKDESKQNLLNELNTKENTYSQVFDQISTLSSSNIRNFIINTYIFCRMKQLFEIIIDYPFSVKVLLDLHECIKLDPFYREKFIQTLKTAFETRLLHPGVSTGDIIEAYITAINALKLLDPQGIILQIVCDPVRNYLKKREDTVRCIITSLTNENLTDLENSKDPTSSKETKDEDKIVLETWKSWVPQPIGVSKLNKDLISSDIISMLVNIFDSKDLFVQEYQRLLSQRLLMNSEINFEVEHRNLELLSLRFGESELHNCEVMLKDIKDSERLNQRINSGEIDHSIPTQFETNGLILSEQFWPENLGFAKSFNDLKNLKLPTEVKEAFDSYTKAFETIKADRTLNWVQQLGLVKLELSMNNGKDVIELSVRPIHAVIIYQFQKRQLWRISELAEELSLLPSVLRRHVSYWKGLGILVEVSHDTFLLDEEGRYSSSHSNQIDCNNSQELDTFEVEEETKNNQEDNNRLQIFWNFIDNMLKNLHALTLDRIFSMLKMFNMQSPEIESLTMHELRQFLDHKVTEGKLVYANGLYNLKPDLSNE